MIYNALDWIFFFLFEIVCHCVALAVLELTEIYLSLHLNTGIKVYVTTSYRKYVFEEFK